MNIEEGFQLKDLTAMVKRRMGVSIVVAGVVALGAVLLAAWLPNRYSASATILVEPQAVSERLIQSGLRDSDLNKRLNIMTAQILSRPRLSRIIDDMSLYQVESETTTREEIIELMRSDIRVAPVLPELQTEGSRNREIEINTFRIAFWSDSAKTAAGVSNRLAQDFIDQHIRERVQLSGDTSEFIQAELERLSSRIREVEDQIAQVKEQNTGSLPEELQSNQSRMARLLERQQALRNQISLAESDYSFYQQQSLVASDQAHTNDEVTNPVRRLDALEISLGALRARGYTDKHPDIVFTLGEIEEVKRLIEAETAVGEEREEPRNLAQQTAAAQANRAQLRAGAAQEDLARVEAEEAELLDRLARTPRVAEQLAALQREWEHLNVKYREFSDKRLQAGVAADVERRQKGEQFRVIESAVAPLAPASPNRILIVAMGIVLGVAFGGMTGLLLESADTSFHGARQLQSALRIPVLAAIPGITLESDRIAARRRMMRRGIVAAGVVGIVLGSSAFGYWWTNLAGGPSSAPPAVERTAAPQGG